MTVAAQTPTITYMGNGTAAALSVPFRFLANDDLVVTLVDEDGLETVMVRGTDYNVAGAGAGSGGTVTPVNAIATGTSWRIDRVTARTQPTNYTDGGGFPAESHELALDRMTLATQEIDREVLDVQTRSLQVPRGETALPMASLADSDGMALVIIDGQIVAAPNDIAGSQQILADVTVIGDAVADNAILVEEDKTQTGLDRIAAADSAEEAATSADAAAISATVYDNEAAGRAAVANGVKFRALGADDADFIDLWQRIDGTASTYLRSYPSSQALLDAFDELVEYQTQVPTVTDLMLSGVEANFITPILLALAELRELVTGGTVPIPPYPDPDIYPLMGSDGVTPALIDILPSEGLFSHNGLLYPSAANLYTVISGVQTGDVLVLGPWRDTTNLLNAANADLGLGTSGFAALAGTTLSIAVESGTNVLVFTANGVATTLSGGFVISNAAHPAIAYEMECDYRRVDVATAVSLVSSSAIGAGTIHSSNNATSYITGRTWGATRNDGGMQYTSARVTGTPANGLSFRGKNFKIYRTKPFATARTPLQGWGVLLEGVTPAAGVGVQVLHCYNNEIPTNYLRIEYDRATGQFLLRLNSLGATLIDYVGGIVAPGGNPFKIAMRVKDLDVQFSVNGYSLIGRTAGAVLTGYRRATWGQFTDGTLPWTGGLYRYAEFAEDPPDAFLQYLAARNSDFAVATGDSGMALTAGYRLSTFIETGLGQPVINRAQGMTIPQEQLSLLMAAPYLRRQKLFLFDMGNGGLTTAGGYIDDLDQILAYQQPGHYTLAGPIVFAAMQSDTTTVAPSGNGQLTLATAQRAALISAYGSAHVVDAHALAMAQALPGGTALGDKDQDDISKGFAPRSLTVDGVHPTIQPGTSLVYHQTVLAPAMVTNMQTQLAA